MMIFRSDSIIFIIDIIITLSIHYDYQRPPLLRLHWVKCYMFLIRGYRIAYYIVNSNYNNNAIDNYCCNQRVLDQHCVYVCVRLRSDVVCILVSILVSILVNQHKHQLNFLQIVICSASVKPAFPTAQYPKLCSLSITHLNVHFSMYTIKASPISPRLGPESY